MRLATFVLLLFIMPAMYSQEYRGPTDSLKNALKAHAKEDTDRVWLLIKVTNAIFTSAPDDAMKYADESLRLSEKIKWQKGIALAYRAKGGVDLVRSDYVSSLDYFQKALLYNQGKSKSFEALVLNNIGVIYSQLKQYDKALKNYKELLAVSAELKNKEFEAMASANIGTAYQNLLKYDSALHYYTRALSVAKEINNEGMTSSVLCMLGALYKDKANYQQSIVYSEQSIQLADKSLNLYVKAPALNNLAWAHFYLLQYDSAEECSKRSLAVSKQLNELQWQSESWEVLYRNYEKQQKFEPALDAYKKYILIRDSALNDEKKQEIARKETQYQADKKDALLKVENDAALNRQRLIRNTIIAGSAVLLLGALISFILYKRKRDAVALQKEAELKTEIAETEMKALRAQMNPHFIFNSLNSISDYMQKNNTKIAGEYLTKFAKLMRLILENSEQKEVPLSQDLMALELYMQLECLRMNNKFTYEIKVDDAVDRENTLVPPLILQPFVENSIWHGIAQKQGQGAITVQIKKEGNMINCSVEDNGIGRKEAALLSSGIGAENKSLGMKITSERINTLNKTKKTTAGIQLSDLQQGTRAEVLLPLELSF